jgi:hypothetical protein
MTHRRSLQPSYGPLFLAKNAHYPVRSITGTLLEAYQHVENHKTPKPLYRPSQVILSHNQGIK